MKINKEKMASLMLGFFIFMSLNLPSLKLVYSSSLLNVIALGGLWITGYIKCYIIEPTGICLNQYKVNYIMQFLLIWTPLFWVTLLQNPVSFTLNSIFQFLSVVFFTLGVVLLTKKSDLSYVFFLQLIWGLFLAISEATVGIPKDRNLGQNYLISGVAIALTIAMLFGYVYSQKSSPLKKVLSLPLILILYGGLFSLNGRAPILFSLIVPLLIAFIGLFYEKVKIKKVVKLTLFPVIVVIIFYLLLTNLPENLSNRLFRLFFSITEEPRFAEYIESIEVILDHPEGIGLQGYADLQLGYPHNIFLEIIMSGGLVMAIPLMIFLVFIAKSVLHTVKYNKEGSIFLSMMLYLFFTWNVSFELSGSYMLFSVISLYIVSTGNIELKRRRMTKPVFSAKEWVNYVPYFSVEKQMDE